MIPDELKKRVPLITESGSEFLKSILENPNAPKWNYECGDRLTQEDFLFLDQFSKKLENREKRNLIIPEKILNWVLENKDKSILLKNNSKGLNLPAEFQKIKPMIREDIALSLEKIVPTEISLDRLIVNSTSGTTGQPIKIPGRPDHIGAYTPLLLFVLKQNEIKINFSENKLNCIMICYQENTAVYATIHSYLNGSGFCKINLHQNSWNTSKDRIQFLEEYNPELITGDPVAFSELLKLDINISPKALVSTSMELSESLKAELEKKFNTKVLDFFSSNETGPLFYKCKKNEFHLLPTDIHLEITNEKHQTLPENTFGEIAVTGGRNPFLPLLRYKTSDFGEIDFSICECNDPMPKVKNLLTRKFVLFKNKKNEIINPIDIVRIIKEKSILQFQMIQKKDLSLEFRFKPIINFTEKEIEEFKNQIQNLFKTEMDLKLFEVNNFDKEKVINFISED